MREGEHPDPATEPTASSSWDAVPVVVVVAILVLLLYLTLLLGAGALFDYFIFSYEGPALGVAELAMVPIGVLAGAVLRSRCAWRTALRNGRWRGIALSSTELPFITAGMLIVVTLYLMASWGGGWHLAARIPGALLTLAVSAAAAALYPRTMAVLAGAIAVPALFGIAAYLVPRELITTIGEDNFWSDTGRNKWAYPRPTGLPGIPDRWEQTAMGQSVWGPVLYHLMRWVGYWVPGILVVSCVLLRKRAIAHALWAGAIAIFIGSGQFYLQQVGEGFGR